MAAAAASLRHGALPRTRLIGREAEIATARALLLDDAVPLLTLIGPCRVGKTRLALQVARDLEAEFSDGICVPCRSTVPASRVRFGSKTRGRAFP